MVVLVVVVHYCGSDAPPTDRPTDRPKTWIGVYLIIIEEERNRS
jgi:hypothetical protein